MSEPFDPNATPEANAMDTQPTIHDHPITTEAQPPPRRRGALIAVAALVVLGLVVGGIIFFTGNKGTSSAYALQFSKAEPGDTYRYHLTMDMDMNMSSPELGLNVPIKGTGAMNAVFRVVSKDADEAATVELAIAEGTIQSNGSTQPIPDTKITMRIAPDGRVLNINGTALSGNSSIGSVSNLGQLTPLLPSKTVKPGDTWTKESEVPFLFGDPLNVSTTNRFTRYETIQGAKAAVIESQANTPIDSDMDLAALGALIGSQGQLPAGIKAHISGTTRSTGTSWVDLTSGRWYKTTNSGDLDMDMVLSGLPAEAGVSQATLHVSGTVGVAMENVA